MCQCDLCGVLTLFCLFVCLFFAFISYLLFFFSFVFFCNCYGIQNKPHEGFFRLILAFYLSLIVSFYVLVDFGCPLSPKGFESNLPETAQQVIRQIQEQNSRGRERALLVASPSMLSSVKRDENHTKDDGVICDLLLFNKELGGLHLFTLVNSGSKDQFLPYSHNTGKAVKESLVMNGGCYEKFYMTCHVVPCERVGTEPLDKLSPNNRYPMEYNLQSSRGKIFKLLRSLVTVLAQFPSFLSNKEGLTFLNLLTKQQFQLLYEQIDEHRELWIHGAAGTGKTVVAVEFIRELLRRDSDLRPGNILYVCENLGILEKVRYVSFKFQRGGLDNVFAVHVLLECLVQLQHTKLTFKLFPDYFRNSLHVSYILRNCCYTLAMFTFLPFMPLVALRSGTLYSVLRVNRSIEF